jgi:tetratricopeptide (TPR) repeat protein
MRNSKGVGRPALLLASIAATLGLSSPGGDTAMATEADSSRTPWTEFDRLWDYNNPSTTEEKFRALLPQAEASPDTALRVELLTQIARAQGLQQKFEDAHATLADAAGLLRPSYNRAKVRWLLEKGRALNSGKHPDQARPLFLEAWELAQRADEDRLALDAAHMMGIIEPADSSLAWNERAIAFAERSSQENAKGWLGPLYNNTGWTYHGMGAYEKALDMFQKSLAFRQERKQEPEIRIAKWCIGRCLRSLGRIDEALAQQRNLLAEFEKIGESDGYVPEEIGECLLAQGKGDEARPYFARAYELLSKDSWLQRDEPQRLERLKELGAGTAAKN